VIKKLIEDEDLLLSCLSTNKKPEEEKKFGKIVIKRKEVKPNQFGKMNLKQIVEIISESELSGAFYPKDPIFINNFILEKRKKEVYEKQDLVDLTRMLIKSQI